MTVKELKELLNAYEDNDEVRVALMDVQGDEPDVELTDVHTRFNRKGKRYVLVY